MGLSDFVDVDNTVSGHTSMTSAITTCEVDQGQQVDQPRQITSAVEVENPIASAPVAELRRTNPGADSTSYNCVKDSAVLSKTELQSSGSELCKLHS